MRKYSLVLVLTLLWACTDPTPQFVRNEAVGGVFGTTYSLIYLSKNTLDLQVGIDSVFNAVNQSLSTYLPGSDISRINHGDTDLVVDEMFREVFELSKEVYEKTNGYFDPTVGVLADAWGFGSGEKLSMDSTKVDSLLPFVGFDKVRLTPEGKIEKSPNEIVLDVDAIAKGYAIDRLGHFLDTKGIQHYLLEVGGELLAKGENEIKKKRWVVGIDDPQMEAGRRLKLKIFLKDKAMASSGNYRKFRIDSLTGKKYVHTIDPRTGYTKNANTLAATILADNCATADAYATAFMAMDLDDALRLLSLQDELEAYIIYLDQQGETQEFMTPGFEELVVDN